MTLQIECTGVSPLLMHSDRAGDPLSNEARWLSEISGKRGKTEAHLVEAARREFHCSIYLDPAGRPTIPIDNAHSCSDVQNAVAPDWREKEHGPEALEGDRSMPEMRPQAQGQGIGLRGIRGTIDEASRPARPAQVRGRRIDLGRKPRILVSSSQSRAPPCSPPAAGGENELPAHLPTRRATQDPVELGERTAPLAPPGGS
ncbi:MAG: hypothetical protein OXF79_21715 [Chloroflexi bacterium]|nr:hypothetical protein [Chloroflexota bacterium]